MKTLRIFALLGVLLVLQGGYAPHRPRARVIIIHVTFEQLRICLALQPVPDVFERMVKAEVGDAAHG